MTVCGVGQESVADMLKLNSPALEGLPLSNPPDEREVPVGIPPPGFAHVIVPSPPVEMNWKLSGLPVVASGRGDWVISWRVEQVTEMLKSLVAVLAVGVVESVRRMVKGKLPTVVGVPDITPVELLRTSPGGSVPNETVQVSGNVPLFSARVWE